MPLHHYLPATFLASFSPDTTTIPRRNRQIFIGDKQTDKFFSRKAGNVAAINNLYTLTNINHAPDTLEQIWAKYEATLDRAIEDMLNQNLSARTWVRVMVPFVACMLVRGPDFNKRFERRIKALGIDPTGENVSGDNTNKARLIELQRLLGPVSVAKWIVIEMRGRVPLITNDLGYAPYFNNKTKEMGMAIPLNLTHALIVIPRNEGRLTIVQSGVWVPDIDYVKSLPGDPDDLNMALASMAQRFIFGSSEDNVRDYLNRPPVKRVTYFPLDPVEIGFITDPLARAHEFTWHRLAAALEIERIEEVSWDFPLDWERLAQGWTPFIYLPTNLLGFPPALYRDETSISAKFYDPSVFYELSRVFNAEQYEDYDSMIERATIGLDLSKDDSIRVKFLVARGAAFDELERYDEALSDYTKALEHEPNSVIALTNRAVTFLKLNKLDDASRDLEKALSYEPNFGVARLSYGTVQYLLGDSIKAIEEATKSMNSLPPGPQKGNAYLSRGIAHTAVGKHEKAIGDFSNARQYIVDRKQLAYCEYHKAIALSKLGRDKAALEAINASIEHDGNSREAHMFKGDLLLSKGKLEEALAEFNKTLELATPDQLTAQALELRARVYTEQGLVELALTDIDQAIKIDEKVTGFHHNRGMILLFLGKVDSALESFNNALALDPQNAGALNNRGITRTLLEQYELAIEDHRKALSIIGKSREAGSPLRNLALCYTKTMNIKSAIKCINNAKKVEPNSPFNYLIDGLICLHQEKFTEGLAHISKAIKKSKSTPDIKIYLSIPLALLGEIENAHALVKECLSTIKSPVVYVQFTHHLRIFRNIFVEKKEFIDFVDAIVQLQQ